MFDTASLGPRSLEMAVAVLGAERIMLGTDYPIFDSRVATDALAAAHLTDAARNAVASGTARRVLGIAP